VTPEDAQRAVIDAARRVTSSNWQELSDPISNGRRNLISLTVAVANLDALGVNSVTS
jgi:hypothetical protein